MKDLIKRIHDNAVNKGFWNDSILINSLLLDERITEDEYFSLRNSVINSKLALITTEVAECTEALRKGDYGNLHEEMADIVIRVLDLAGARNIDLEKIILDKVEKNESRSYLHGKQF